MFESKEPTPVSVDTNERRYKKGDVVFAAAVLMDKYMNGRYWIIATFGQLGVVNDYGQQHPAYDVSWANGHQCTVHVDDINLYQGRVVRITE